MMRKISTNILILVQKRNSSTNMYLILNSKDMLKFLILTMIIIWCCISAERLLNILVLRQDIEFQITRHGLMLLVQALISQLGHKVHTFSITRLKLSHYIMKMSRSCGDHKVIEKNILNQLAKRNQVSLGKNWKHKEMLCQLIIDILI